ncbi:MAG TPA: ribosome small subunit-dependent GTPase A [Bacillota bacterium]|nr:ribosome small subunit-dependent GTPase A [Bacillota bacterium]
MLQNGIVIKAYGGFYYVRTAEALLECRLRGKFRLEKRNALIGDRVNIKLLENGKGVIEEILPRRNELIRPPVVNVDKVLLVMAGHQPEPDFGLLDRMLILAVNQRLTPLICFNKCDLLAEEERKAFRRIYKGTGYQVELVSAKEGVGLDNVRLALKDTVSVIAGPSGAGKSTLLNRIEPSLALKTGKVSEKIGRGKHTTRHVELLPLSFGGLVADTPGFSSLELPKMRREELAPYFPEFESYTHLCRFHGCMHEKEPECGVKDAVAQQEISQQRYENYLQFLAEVRATERRY